LFAKLRWQVLASVHGPIAPRQVQQETPDCRLQVLIKSGTAHGTYEREWEGFLTRILTECCQTDAYPRCILQITIQIISADGSVLPAALHAAVSALMDAGMELRTLPTAVTCLLPHNSSQIRLDPCQAEELQEDAAALVLVLETPEKLLGVHSAANLQQSMPTILQCCAVAARASQAVEAFWRLAIESKVQRESQTLWSSLS
jgi:exosome complex component RRP46